MLITIKSPETKSKNLNPLVINESIDDIVNSLERDIYNVDEKYRSGLRKIRNNLQLLNIKESDLVNFNNLEFNNGNLLENLNTTISLAIDCLVNDLVVNKNADLKNVNSISELVLISSPSRKIIDDLLYETKNIVENLDLSKSSSTMFFKHINDSFQVSKGRYCNIQNNSYNSLVQYYTDYVLEHLEDFIVIGDLDQTRINIKNKVFVEATIDLNQNEASSAFKIILAFIGILITVGYVVFKIMSHNSDTIDELRDALAGDAYNQFQALDKSRQKEFISAINEMSIPEMLLWGGLSVVFIGSLLTLLYDRSLPFSDFIDNLFVFYKLNKKLKKINKEILDSKVNPNYGPMSEFFDVVEEEYKDCLQLKRTRSNINQHVICTENYLNTLYGGFVYYTLLQLRSENINIYKFDMSDLYGYSGFASFSARKFIEQYKELYDLITDYYQEIQS